MSIETKAPTSNITTLEPTPSPANIPRPEGAAENVTTESWRDVQVTAYTSLVTGAVLMTLFEYMRGRRNRMSRSMYRQRHSL